MTYQSLCTTLRNTAADTVAAGRSKYAIGRAAGLNAGSVSRFISGKATKHGPDISTLARMAGCFGKRIEFHLVEDTDVEPDGSATKT